MIDLIDLLALPLLNQEAMKTASTDEIFVNTLLNQAAAVNKNGSNSILFYKSIL